MVPFCYLCHRVALLVFGHLLRPEHHTQGVLLYGSAATSKNCLLNRFGVSCDSGLVFEMQPLSTAAHLEYKRIPPLAACRSNYIKTPSKQATDPLFTVQNPTVVFVQTPPTTITFVTGLKEQVSARNLP